MSKLVFSWPKQLNFTHYFLPLSIKEQRPTWWIFAGSSWTAGAIAKWRQAVPPPTTSMKVAIVTIHQNLSQRLALREGKKWKDVMTWSQQRWRAKLYNQDKIASSGKRSALHTKTPKQTWLPQKMIPTTLRKKHFNLNIEFKEVTNIYAKKPWKFIWFTTHTDAFNNNSSSSSDPV